MSGTTRSSADLDPRRRRLLFRAWHRGTREMDLIVGRFCDSEISLLDEAELDEFEVLIEAQDQDLYNWVAGSAEVPASYDTRVFRRLRDFYAPQGAPKRS